MSHVSPPERTGFENRLATTGTVHQVVIDEVQKVPQLLDEVHWLLENRRNERVNMDFTLS